MLTCSWKETYGVDCPTCGTQRAFDLLISGDLYGSIVMFPALLPLIFTILFTCVHLIFKFKHGAKWIVILFSVSAGLIFINYLVKIPGIIAAAGHH